MHMPFHVEKLNLTNVICLRIDDLGKIFQTSLHQSHGNIMLLDN